MRNSFPEQTKREKTILVGLVGLSVFLLMGLWWVTVSAQGGSASGGTRGLPAEALAQAGDSHLPSADLNAGREAYMTNCARCHGDTGAGDGRDALLISPRPRPLAEGVFKFRTTASGTPPTDQDLYDTIGRGLPGSRMPDFQRLPEETRWQLVHTIKSLSSVFEETAPEPLDLGTDPGATQADLAQGRQVYEKLGCGSCHGDQGRGNGPSAATLQDDWGQPIQAADLTQGWRYRGGESAKDILTRLLAGLDGTPMPSYAEATTPEEAWHLAYYVHSLQEEPNFARSLEATAIAGPLPTDPEDPQWQSAPNTDWMLAANLYENQEILPTAVHAISARALYNESEITFRLQWHDRSESRAGLPDKVTLALLADPRNRWKVGSLRSWPASAAAAPLDLLYWTAERNTAARAVANDLSDIERGKVQASWQEASSRYEEGRWTLLLKRPLQPEEREAVALDRQKRTLVGLMVWDGGNNETGRRRASSNWVELILK